MRILKSVPKISCITYKTVPDINGNVNHYVTFHRKGGKKSKNNTYRITSRRGTIRLRKVFNSQNGKLYMFPRFYTGSIFVQWYPIRTLSLENIAKFFNLAWIVIILWASSGIFKEVLENGFDKRFILFLSFLGFWVVGNLALRLWEIHRRKK